MRVLIAILTFVILLTACKKEFSLPDTAADSSVLVVEGDILVGNNMENTFLLSRLKNLKGSDSIPETKAKVEIISGNGQKWQLADLAASEFFYSVADQIYRAHGRRIVNYIEWQDRDMLKAAHQSPEFRKKLEATGSVVASPTVDTDKYIASEITRYRPAAIKKAVFSISHPCRSASLLI